MPDYTEQKLIASDVSVVKVYRCEHCGALTKPHALDILFHLDRAHEIRAGGGR